MYEKLSINLNPTPWLSDFNKSNAVDTEWNVGIRVRLVQSTAWYKFSLVCLVVFCREQKRDEITEEKKKKKRIERRK